MSYKDGIPLLKPFEDDQEDDDEDFLIEPRVRRVRCRKKHVCFGILVFLAVLVIAGVAAGIAVPVILLGHGGSTSGVQGGNQSENSSFIEMPMSMSLPAMNGSSSPTPVMIHSTSPALLKPNLTTVHFMAHSSSVVRTSSMSSQGLPPSTQKKTTQASTVTPSMTLHTTQLPTPTTSTTKAVSVTTRFSSTVPTVVPSVSTGFVPMTRSVPAMNRSTTPLMTQSTPSVVMMTPSSSSVPMMTPPMTMANGIVPKATSSVAVMNQSTPTVTQPSNMMTPSIAVMNQSTSTMTRPSSMITPSISMMNRSTPTMTQPSSMMTPSTAMMNRSTPTVTRPSFMITQSISITNRSTPTITQPSSMMTPSTAMMNRSTPTVTRPSFMITQSISITNRSTPTMTRPSNMLTPSISVMNQSTPTMTRSSSTTSPSISVMNRSTPTMTQPNSMMSRSVLVVNQSTFMMTSFTPTMTQLGSPVLTMTPFSSMAKQTHSSVAMTTQRSSHGILPTHPSPTPTFYIATNSLAPTPVVSSQKQMVSTVLPTPTPSSSSAHVTVSASYTSSSTATPAMTPSPTPGAVGKSALDHRTYQVLYLENQLRVLLISDPNTSISAAAMDVAVGSFSDPPEVQGLAHFCEHMLFLGTQKYPKEDDYSNFLSTHGGNDNAFTSTQETNYYFSLQADYLEQALDRFAQFFISPLFTPGAVNKEAHAVNAEHEKNLQSDGWRLWQLMKHVSNPSHPFSRFATGNLETLNNPDILTYLHKYYSSHYSANQMELVIYGKHPIENLTVWADEYFSPIANRNVSAPTFNTTSFPPEYSGKIVYYYPVANKDTLHIYWQTPPLQDKYRNAVSQFLTRYLGHEGEGSILSLLKSDSLATSLTAGTELNTDSYTLLFVSVDVTTDGLSHLSEVISIVFQYLRYLKSHFGEQEWEDFVNVSQLNFDYAEKAKAKDYVVTISEAMRLVTDPADFLGTPHRFVSNFSLVNDTLNYLTPANTVIFIGSQKLNFNGSSRLPVSQHGPEPVPWPSQLTEFEPIYGTPYQKTNLSSGLVDYWRTDDNDKTASLHLPGTNQFFPKDLNVLEAPENVSKIPVEIPIDSYPGVSLWWLQDTEFREPRVYLHCDLNTSNAENTAAWTAKSQLFVSSVDQLLKSRVYAAEEVGYSYSLSATPHGLTLSFSGLSDTVTFGKFISLVTHVLSNINVQKEKYKLYSLAKDDETDYLMNYNLTTLPYTYYRYIQSVVLDQPYWRHWELLSEVKQPDLEEIMSFADNLLSDVTLLCFAHGNINHSQAVNYTHTLVSPLSSKLTETCPVGHFWRRRVKLASGTNYSVVIPALNPEDVNSVVNVLFQVGSVCHLVQSEEPGSHACSLHSLRTYVLLGLLNQIMEDQCFYQLRTIQQLGYVAFCHNRVNEGVGSFEVVVQSQEYEPGDVLERIDSFVESFEDYLSNNMTEEEWETQVEVYGDTLQRKDTNLANKNSRLWGQISTGQLQFDLNGEAVGVLDTLNSRTLHDFYHDNIVNANSYKKMVIVAYGRGKSGNLTYINNPLDYTHLNLTAMTTLPTTCESGTVDKSALDHRTYQVLCLKNQLRVLLISDPNTSISAAAMDVAVGSFSDPSEVQGLAHFCEHMLFLGTQKYPKEDDYSNFLSTHGGYDNAFTSTQETNYYFSVQADYLEQALDRFAQFFISPLFTPGAVRKESHAVNAEHEKNLQSDEWRLWQLLKHVSNPSHPFSRFATGNLETLNNSNILNYLHDYYTSHYSANQMQLVIYGRDPIENLTVWANEYFSPIINRGVSAPMFNATSFPSDYSRKVVYYYPVANKDTLHIYWQTPPLQDKYRNAVSQFLTRYLGHQGEGSISWKLRTDSLATSLTAGTELDTDSYTLLFVSIDVTTDGLSRLSEIISIVFQYVRLLKSNLGPQEWEDFVNVSQLNFDYAEKAKARDYVVTISEAMRLVTDPTDFLATPHHFVSNFSLVNDTLNYLTPANSVIFLGSQKFNFNGSSHLPVSQHGPEPVPWPSQLTMFEPIYGTPYQETNLSSRLVDYWRTDDDATAFLHLPGTNQFIPKDLSVLKAPDNVSKIPVETPIDNYPGVSLWWLQDTEFHEPRVYLHCDLNTSNAENTAAWTAKSQLFVSSVDQLLKSKVYAAKEVGYSYSLSPSPDGLTLSFSGLSDPVTFGKFINLVTGVLNHINDQKEKYELYSLAKDEGTDYLMNYNLTTLPYKYYRYIQSVVLEQPYWRHWELLLEVKKLDFEEIVSFANNLLSNVTMLCFAHGNVNQIMATNYTHTLVSPLSSKLTQTHPVGHFPRRRVKLSSGTNYSVVIPALNPEDVNSVVNVLFQVGSVCHLVQSKEAESRVCSVDTLRTSVLLGLLNQIMEDQCFYQLRTIQQLGYVAFCHNRVNEGVGSFEVVVQSQEYEPGDVLERIDSFVESFESNLSNNLMEGKWETQVEVYRDTLQRKDTNLADKNSRLWVQISTGQLQFDYNAEAAHVLDSLNSTTLQNFYHDNMVDTNSYKKMVIVAYGRGKSGNITYINNPLDYTQLNLTALTPLPTTCESGTVDKSAMDHRTYQVLCLENQLRVLLISDPNTSVSAAAMDVAVGSFSDPPEVQGLAHFCEHMLFLGTQKYPKEDDYSNFLSTHGGYDNAFTSTQETNYYFSVQADYLEQALDRFAQFFISPLFTPGAVRKESHAVNAEHEKNLQSDEWRLWQLLKHISNPSHPFSRFATGNLETLNNSNILNYLHDYYTSHYSANQMQLVIYGRDPIEKLTVWANEYFSPIINHGVSAPTFDTTSFPPEYSRKIVYYYPVANKDTLHIYWQTPPLQDKYRNAVSQFLTRYLGHQGEGSISWKLRTDSLATSLTAGTELDTDSYTLLFVSIDVTTDGLSRLSEIISIVFQYVRLLKSNLGPQEWEDFVNVSQLNFDYAEKAKARDYVVTISEAMRLVTDPTDFLATPHHFVSNFSLVNDTLNYLTTANSVIFLGSQKFNFNGSSRLPVSQHGPEPVPWPSQLTMFEPIYGTPYQETNLSSRLVDYWRTDDDATASLHLPGTNQFIPKDLSVLKAPDNVSKIPVETPIDNYPGVSLWWLQDTEFHEPRVYLHCDLNTSNAENTAAWTAKSQLFVSSVDQLLKSKVYAAKEVGYSYSLSPSPDGLTLSFSGLSDPVTFGKFINLVTGVLNHINDQKEKYELYSLAKDEETDYLMNYNLTTLPYKYYRYIQSVVLEQPYWRHWELLSEVKKLDFEEIVSFANNLLSNATMLCFAHGNVNQIMATNYTHTLVSPLSSKLTQTHPVGHFPRRRVKLSSGTNYSVVIPALNPEDVNSVVNVLFQVGSVCHLVQSKEAESRVCSVDTLRTSVLLGLLNQIMEDQCFYQLRTIQQLGYVAFCHNRVNEGVGSFEVVVQSQEYEPGDVLEQIDSFVESFESNLSNNLMEGKWETQVEVYRDTLQRKDTNLADKNSRLWGQISTGQLQFDYNTEAACVLDSLNSTTLQNFYHDNMVDTNSYKKMVILAYGRGKSGNITNIDNSVDYTQLSFTEVYDPL